jgi:hypothetical protein
MEYKQPAGCADIIRTYIVEHVRSSGLTTAARLVGWRPMKFRV